MFHNKQLQQIHDESKDSLNQYLNSLDKLSDDIKLMEKILKSSGIGEFSVEFEKCKFLLFSEGRLQYLDCSESVINHNPNPLIEKKACVRMEVAPYLTEFFEKCMDKIKNGVKNVGNI